MSRVLPILVLALTLSGCAKKNKSTSGDDLDVTTLGAPTRNGVPADVVAEVLGNFEKVHFDTDSSSLDASARAVLAANAKIMVEHPGITVLIEGHADERGTNDYNLALGQARAEAVRSFLVGQGVTASRVRTVTFGEERPAVKGHDEVAWAQNRRAEFRVSTN